MVRALLAEGGIVEAAHRGCQPHPAFPVDHHVVVVDPRVPDLPVTPISRRHYRPLAAHPAELRQLVRRHGPKSRPRCFASESLSIKPYRLGAVDRGLISP